MSVPWWLGLTPVEASVACQGRDHRVRWSEGVFQTPEHREPELERTLAVLGTEPCACVDMADAWSRRSADLRVLVLGSRGPSDRLINRLGQGRHHPPGLMGTAANTSLPRRLPRGPAGPLSALRRGGAGPIYSYAPISEEVAERSEFAQDSAALAALGPGMFERLVATVAAEWSMRLLTPDEGTERARPSLHAGLAGRATLAVRSWLGVADLEVDVDLVGPSDRPTLNRTEGGIHADLPFAWVAEVWARGLSVSWGRFCLGARSTGAGHWELDTLDHGLGPLGQIRVEVPG